MSAEKEENITIESVDQTDRDAILDVLRESFYKVLLKYLPSWPIQIRLWKKKRKKSV